MLVDFLIEVFRQSQDTEAMVWHDQCFSYRWILDRFAFWQQVIIEKTIEPGAVVILDADLSPNSVAAFLALVGHRTVVVPLTNPPDARREELFSVAQGEFLIKMREDDDFSITKIPHRARHDLYQRLRGADCPGLVLFSSGSTGESKAAVHDMSMLLKKYIIRRHNLRTLAFLLLDHIGGIDTLLYGLSNGSCIVTIQNRSPDAVCQSIDKHKVEVLPVTPTFLNLLIMSEAYKRYDLSSLKYITYGTEVMPEITLRRCSEIFTNVTILQKYGTTEVGTLRSKSKRSDSVWVKIGGEGYRTRVVEGVLHIKAESAMLGYLNAPSPFTDDGWFITGDSVEQDGEFIRILGRKSEIINVGGEKVYPAEVENVIQEMDGIAEVAVYGEENPIVGNIVCARVRPVADVSPRELAVRVKKYCRERLEPYKSPVKIVITEAKQHSSRFKKKRPRNGPSA